MNAPAVSERDFTTLVIDLAHVYRWRVCHFRPAMDSRGRWKTPVQADGAGFPDMVMVRGERLIFAELKTDTGAMSNKQRRWLNGLREAHNEVYLWRPKDYSEIERVLKGE